MCMLRLIMWVRYSLCRPCVVLILLSRLAPVWIRSLRNLVVRLLIVVILGRLWLISGSRRLVGLILRVIRPIRVMVMSYGLR